MGYAGEAPTMPPRTLGPTAQRILQVPMEPNPAPLRRPGWTTADALRRVGADLNVTPDRIAMRNARLDELLNRGGALMDAPPNRLAPAVEGLAKITRPNVVPNAMSYLPPDAIQKAMYQAPIRTSAEKAANFGSFFPKAAEVAAQEAAPVVRSVAEAAPAAAEGVRGALGTAAKGVGLASRAYGYGAAALGMGESLADVTRPLRGAGKSELSEAGRPYREAFYRNLRNGSIPAAAGDFVMANVVPAASYARRLVMPDTLWANTDEKRGMIPEMLGSESPTQRAAREQNEVAIEASRQAFMQREAARSAQPVAAGAAMSEMGGVPLNVMEHYAKIYGAMAPKGQSTNDKLKAITANAIMERLKAEMESTDPKVKAQARNNYIRSLGALTTKPDYSLYGAGNLYEE
jgi:hypothetical protein